MFKKRLLSLIVVAALLLSFPIGSLAAAKGTKSAQVVSCFTHSAALWDGTLYVWGSNSAGQLPAQSESCSIPTEAAKDVSAVSVATNYTLVVHTDGSLLLYGADPYSKSLSGANGRLISSGVAAVAASDAFALFLKADGSLWGWGDNSSGQLGLGTTVSQPEPVKILDNVIHMSAGGGFSLAVKADHALYGWGANTFFQLSIGDPSSAVIGRPSPTDYIYTPTLITTDVANVSAGLYHSLVLKTDGSLWTCGNGDYGQLGTSANVTGDSLTKVLSDISEISAGSLHNLARTKGGLIYAWGKNTDGQLGDFSGDTIYEPRVVSYDGFTVLGAGRDTSFGLTSDGALWAWGSNYNDVLGAQLGSSVSDPTKVASFSSGSETPPVTDPGDSEHGSAGFPSQGETPIAFVNGYSDGTFRPGANINRSEFTKMLVVAANLYHKDMKYSGSFADVSGGAWYSPYVFCAQEAGLTTGFSDGTFRPEATISRAEVAVMIARALTLPSAVTPAVPFSDLPPSHWAYGYTNALYQAGVVSGLSDGLFHPEAPISRAEACTMLVRAMGGVPTEAAYNAILSQTQSPFTDVAPSHWAFVYIMRSAGVA